MMKTKQLKEIQNDENETIDSKIDLLTHFYWEIQGVRRNMTVGE